MSTSQQQISLALFEDELDAIREAVRALGGTKIVGHGLRPDLKPDAAGAWLKDCMNSDRREKLDLSQVIRLMRMAHDAGVHAPAVFLASEMGYSAQPIEPADEVAGLQRAFIEAVNYQKSIVERMERVTKAPIHSLKSA